jgi:serine/threonine protein kinase
LKAFHRDLLEEREVFSPLVGERKGKKEDDIHFLFPKAIRDIHSQIRKKISYKERQLLICQLFLGLEHLHLNGIIHRDIKPRNLLFFKAKKGDKVYYENLFPDEVYTGTLTIADFGMAKFFSKQDPMTDSIVTLWYRAPEVCQVEAYDYCADVWSAGCVAYEILFRKALFPISFDVSSEDENNEVLRAIQDGHPDTEDIEGVPPCPDKPFSFIAKSGMNEDKVVDMCNEMGSSPEDLEELLRKMLRCEKEDRLTITEALDSPYFDRLRKYIRGYRKLNKKLIPREVEIYNGIERKWTVPHVNDIWKRKDTFRNMNLRILFQVVNMYYRYLQYLDEQSGDSPVIRKSKYKGKLLTIQEGQKVLDTITYMCINYFTTIHGTIPFSKVSTTTTIKDASKIEKVIIKNVCNMKFYEPTPLEEADKHDMILDDTDQYALLLFYCLCPHIDSDNSETFRKFLSRKEDMRRELYNYFTKSYRDQYHDNAISIASQ